MVLNLLFDYFVPISTQFLQIIYIEIISHNNHIFELQLHTIPKSYLNKYLQFPDESRNVKSGM